VRVGPLYKHGTQIVTPQIPQYLVTRKRGPNRLERSCTVTCANMVIESVKLDLEKHRKEMEALNLEYDPVVPVSAVPDRVVNSPMIKKRGSVSSLDLRSNTMSASPEPAKRTTSSDRSGVRKRFHTKFDEILKKPKKDKKPSSS
jgi:hypothetical protein